MKRLIVLLTTLLTGCAFGGTIKPETLQDFNKVTVKVMGKGGGGSGVILKSSKSGSYILTNRHVCNIATRGGVLKIITSERKSFNVEKYKFSKKHDICVAKVSADLGYSTKISQRRTKFGEEVTVSGHPYLYPNMIKTGHMSGDMTISIVTGWAECTKKEYKETWLCSWFGKLPIVSRLESQTASFSIAGGNSGSAVFNSDGEITALVYAGSGKGMSPAILVPHEYITSFIRDEISKVSWNKLDNSYVYGRVAASEKAITFDGKVQKSMEDLTSINLKFPAIHSEEQEKFITTYNCMKRGTGLCLVK